MAKYDFSFNSFQITNTRSRHEDTDTAGFAIIINNGTPQIKTQLMGDLNNGTYHPKELCFTNIDVADTDAVYFSYYVVNAGHTNGGVACEKLLGSCLEKVAGVLVTSTIGNEINDAMIGEAIGYAIGSVVPGLGNLLGALAGASAGFVWGLLSADCDGPVVFGGHAYTGAQIASQTNISPLEATEFFPG